MSHINLIANKQMADLLLRQLQTTQQSLCCTIYSASPPGAGSSAVKRQLWAQIQTIAQRGVSCCAIMCAWSPRTPHAEANRMTARLLVECGWEIRWVSAGRILHAKSWLFDDRVAIIGSHNLTDSGLWENHELSVHSDDPNLVRDLNAYMTTLWNAATPWQQIGNG